MKAERSRRPTSSMAGAVVALLAVGCSAASQSAHDASVGPPTDSGSDSRRTPDAGADHGSKSEPDGGTKGPDGSKGHDGGGPGGATAVFLGTDTTTQGQWKGMNVPGSPQPRSAYVYGKDGNVIPDTEGNPAGNPVPSYATFVVEGPPSTEGPLNDSGIGYQCNYTWASNILPSVAPYELQVAWSSPVDYRQASCWYTCSQLSVNTYDLNVALSDGKAHNFELYALDYEHSSYPDSMNIPRAETLQVVDATSGAVLDTQTVSAFTNGIYYKWSLSGHVKINVTVTSGPNAVISGAFFD